MHPLIDLVVGIVTALLLVQGGTRLLARRSIGRRVAAAPGDDAPGRVVYYFHAPRCGPCKAMTPVVDNLRQSFANLRKVDVTDEPELARRMGVMATPSFVVVDDGVITMVKLGPQRESALRSWLGAA